MRSAGFPRRARLGTPLALGVIVGIAVVLRVVHLGTFPPGVYPDVAANGLDALHLSGQGPRVFYGRGSGNEIEGMIVWLEWLVTQVVGREPIFLYLTTVLIGVVTIPVHYLLASRLFTRRVGLLSAAILAVSFWDVHFSRLGYRTVLMPLFCDLVFLSAVWAVRRGGRWRWAVAGIVFGLGNYTYTSYRLIVLVFAGLALHRWWTRRRLPGTLGEWASAAAAALVVTAPMIVAAAVDFSAFYGRAEGVSVLQGPWTGIPVRLVDRLSRTIPMFNLIGDPEKQYDVPHLPLFDPLVGLGFLAGVVVAWRRRAEARYALLLLWLFLFSLVVGLTDRPPHVLRASGVVPAACILAAVGLDRVAGRFRPAVARAALVAVLALATAWTSAWYFVAYPRVDGLYAEFHGDGIELGRFMNDSDFGGRRLYLVMTFYRSGGPPSPDRFRAQAAEFETSGRHEYTFLPFTDVDHLGDAPAVVVYDASDVEARSRLARRFPAGAVVYTLALPEGYTYLVFTSDGGRITPSPPGGYSNT